jgi:2-haloalkanoic acid dehalogenase type II
MRMMKLTDFDALSFDCYGTLIDWEAGLSAGLVQIAGLTPGLAAVDDLLDTYGEIEAAIERDHPTLPYPEVIARSIITTGDAHGISVPSVLAQAIGGSVPDWPAFPDSAEALQRLKERFKLIILSNVDDLSFAGSNRHLGVTFDAILTAQQIGSYKPNPANFEALLAKIDEMGIARDRLLHVAQSLFHDHVPAKAIGLPTVWINRRGDSGAGGATPLPPDAPTPDWVFLSMEAFADAVDAEGDPKT